MPRLGEPRHDWAVGWLILLIAQMQSNRCRLVTRADDCSWLRCAPIAEARFEMLGGQVQMINTMPAMVAQVRAGRLSPLAVTTATRAEVTTRLRGMPPGENGLLLEI
jgi:hypothetical protein